MLAAELLAKDGKPADISDLPERDGSGSASASASDRCADWMRCCNFAVDRTTFDSQCYVLGFLP
jgi:hypothetical protein